MDATELVRRGGGGHTWTEGYAASDGQENFVEVVVFVCVTSVAVLFEVGHHYLHHVLEHNINLGVLAAYGQTAHHVPPRPKHKLIGGNGHAMNLFNRLSAELMVLGFVAFVVWSCYQAKMFHDIADDLAKTYTSSPDYYYIYNGCHNVHIWLFLAMIWHFLLSIVCIIRISTTQKQWAQFDKDPAAAEAESNNDAYIRYRDEKKLFINHFKKKNMDGMDENFNFGLYLSLNLDRVLEDFYHFHLVSWLIVLMVKVVEMAVLGGMSAESKWDWYDQLILMLYPCVLSPVVLIIFFFMRHKDLSADLERGHFEIADHEEKTFGEKYDIELWFSRLIQGLSFTLAYETMSWATYKGLYTGDATKSWPGSKDGPIAGVACMLIFLQVLNVLMVPKVQRSLSVKYALPPYVDEENKALIEAVIASGFLVENHRENDAPTISNVKQESNFEIVAKSDNPTASNATKNGPDVQISMGSDPIQSI